MVPKHVLAGSHVKQQPLQKHGVMLETIVGFAILLESAVPADILKSCTTAVSTRTGNPQFIPVRNIMAGFCCSSSSKGA